MGRRRRRIAPGSASGPRVPHQQIITDGEHPDIAKKRANEHRPVRIQFGALPYRINGETGIEVLLVTSRGTKRWIIPKGWPIKGFKPPKTAAREAYEEAGVRGRVSGRPLGRYVYEKQLDDRVASLPCEVQVFPLLVKRQFERWPECRQRTVRWFAAPEAAAAIDNDDLRQLILQLKARKPRAGRRHPHSKK